MNKPIKTFNSTQAKANLYNLVDQAAMFTVPDDFDTMGSDEMVRMFEGEG